MGNVSYPGDARTIMGRVVELPQGGLAEAVLAEYNPDTDRTYVQFRRVSRDDQRLVAPDEFGQFRVLSEEGS